MTGTMYQPPLLTCLSFARGVSFGMYYINVNMMTVHCLVGMCVRTIDVHACIHAWAMHGCVRMHLCV